ncbi:hypothetical protein AQ490_02165 [Wenjunlia vitaminophila]|uniref:DUF4439 domain-containing protein n=1 Tax=Wenjunlia vitaminophila TaxID=76728 RepID=A0A0T6LZB4_WENVI|nr:hypothetical protein AQ490_02165 [Wenjunlia vitaminophila]
MAAEHAAIYGYGVLGARLTGERRNQARDAYQAHRSQRDALRRSVRGLGGEPEAAAPAYGLPFPVPDQEAAIRLAAELEDRVAAVYADLVARAEADLRRDAARALREAAVRAVRWRGRGVPFPGLPERAGTASGAPTTPGAVSPGSG